MKWTFLVLIIVPVLFLSRPSFSAAQSDGITAWRVVSNKDCCLLYLGKTIADATIVGSRSAIANALSAKVIAPSCALLLRDTAQLEDWIFQKCLIPIDVPPGYGGGDSTEIFIRFNNPTDFLDALSRAKKQSNCSPVMEWCANSKKEIAFSAGCEGIIDIKVSTSGEVSLTLTQGKRSVSVPLTE